MKAVILAGGLGTRISEETDLKPKPMIEIGGRPILWHIMKIYSFYGINDFIICCGYKGYLIKEYFANYFLHMSDVTFDIQDNKIDIHQNKSEPWKVSLIDTGESTPTYLDNSVSENLFSREIQQTLKNIALERGIYIELPEFDLEDNNLLSQTNVLFSPSNYIQEKFYNDAFLTIELVRIGINQWSVNGDLQTVTLLQEKQVISFFQNAVHALLDDFLAVEPLKPGASGEKVTVSIQGLNNFDDFKSAESELDKIFAIKSRDFLSFERTKVDYVTQLFQTTDALMKELRGSTKFLIKEYNADTDELKLEYLN